MVTIASLSVNIQTVAQPVGYTASKDTIMEATNAMYNHLRSDRRSSGPQQHQ